MRILITTKITRTPGPSVRINCPKCGPESPAVSYQRVEKMGLFYVPLITQRETHVKCRGCGAVRVTRLPLHQLAAYSADELEDHLHKRVSIIVSVLAVASVLLFCAPFLGLALAVISLLVSYRTGGWPKWASLVGVVLSLPVSGFALYAVLTS